MFRYSPAGFILPICLALTIAPPETDAQIFQAAYGNIMVEDGRGGVQPLANGNGYISVGYTSSFGANDIYVLQSDLNGGIIWAKRYDFGGPDHGHDIQECGNGDFVITGRTHSGSADDMFIMRIDPLGNHIWTRVFNGGDNDYGMDVMEASNGDIVAAGWTQSSPNIGTRDGLIVRLTSAGANLWVRTYAPAGGGSTDQFMGLWEASNTDLLVSGATQSFGSGSQGWLLRTSSGGVPAWSRHTGGGSAEVFNSVIELTLAPNTSNIIVAGATGASYYVAKFNAGGLKLIEYAGGVSGAMNEMFQVRENLNVNPGSILMTGVTNPGPIGMSDGYAVVTDPDLLCGGGNVTNPVWSMIYGDLLNDNLYSGHEVPGNCNEGYILCGQFTMTVPVTFPNSPVQHYLVKTDAGGSTGCLELPRTETCNGATLPSTAVNILATVRPAVTTKNTTGIDITGIDPLCFTACPPGKRSTPDNDDAGNDRTNAYPNPIIAGAPFRISYTLGAGSDVAVTVADMSGRIVSTKSMTSRDGMGMLSIETEGWPAGVYLVRVDLGSEVQTKRIVVMER